MTTSNFFRLQALAVLAAAQMSSAAFGQFPPELGDVRMDIPQSWSQLPRSNEVTIPAAPIDGQTLSRAVYRGMEPRVDGVTLTVVYRYGRTAESPSIPNGPGEMTGGPAAASAARERMERMSAERSTLIPFRSTDLSSALGLNRESGAGTTELIRLPKVSSDGEKCSVSFFRVRNVMDSPALLLNISYVPQAAAPKNLVALTLYCPGNREGSEASRDLLESLVVLGYDAGRAIQDEEAWRSYFNYYQGGGSSSLMTPEEKASTTPTTASAPTPADAAPPVTNPPSPAVNIGDLVQKHQNSLVLFEGKLGAGSGFVARNGATDLVFTNIHVVAADQGLKLRTMTGAKVAVGAAEAAVDHDILRFRLPDGTPNSSTLELMPNVSATVKVGDEVAVLGNSEGAGVVQALRGRVVGIGPDRVEIDAQFIPGNSGSPVIHTASGQVIGIATYIMVHDTSFDGDGSSSSSQGRGKKSFRRFAYRFDSVTEWQPVNWPVFYKQAAELNRSQALTRNVYAFMSDLVNERRIDVGTHNDPAIRSQVADYVRLAGTTERMSESDVKNAVGRMFSSLRSACKQELGPATAKGYYDFFWDGFQEEKEVRNKLVEGFDRTLKRVGRY